MYLNLGFIAIVTAARELSKNSNIKILQNVRQRTSWDYFNRFLPTGFVTVTGTAPMEKTKTGLLANALRIS